MKKVDSVVLLSGGQDSSTCLAIAAQHAKQKQDQDGIEREILALSIEYGQKHKREIIQAETIRSLISERIGVPIFRESFYAGGKLLGQSSLTKDKEVHAGEKNGILPATFVPGRNLFFLSFATSRALSLEADKVFIGVSQIDYSGYPDCRFEFIESFQKTLDLALVDSGRSIKIVTPLIKASKAETFLLADAFKILDIIIRETRTCYNTPEDMDDEIDNPDFKLHDWGWGCGKCDACLLREKGWVEYLGKTQFSG